MMQARLNEIDETFSFWAMQLSPGNWKSYKTELEVTPILEFYAEIDTYTQIKERQNKQSKGAPSEGDKFGLWQNDKT